MWAVYHHHHHHHLCNTRYSYLVTQSSRNPAEYCLTLLIRRDAVMSLWVLVVPVTLVKNRFLFLRSLKKKQRKKKNSLILKQEIKKWERNENYYLLWWLDKKRYFLYNCLGKGSPITYECFNGVTSTRVFSYRCVLRYLLTMPVGFNLNFDCTDQNLKAVATKLLLFTDDPFSKLNK